MNKIQMLQLLDQEKVKQCQKCTELCQSRTNTVFGEGNENTRVMIIGEAPGRNEDEDGRPFCGPAGQLLDGMIAACGWKRQDVFIANCLKCRPPANRRPSQTELANCWPYLELQIRIVNPRYILCLGNTAAQTLLQKPWENISHLRQKIHEWNGKTVVCTYHPSYILQAADEKAEDIKRMVWDDLQRLLKEMKANEDN